MLNFSPWLFLGHGHMTLFSKTALPWRSHWFVVDEKVNQDLGPSTEQGQAPRPLMTWSQSVWSQSVSYKCPPPRSSVLKSRVLCFLKEMENSLALIHCCTQGERCHSVLWTLTAVSGVLTGFLLKSAMLAPRSKPLPDSGQQKGSLEIFFLNKCPGLHCRCLNFSLHF